MIDNPYPEDWKELQNGVSRLFNEIGLTSETEKVINTPRGSVEVDVYAIDKKSDDKIEYIVECKNWANPIPQSVVHSFTTVMYETGANIGFIISKVGLQTGAKNYTQSTNITGMSYLQLQERYFNVWWQRYFCSTLANTAESVIQYVEPINSRRSRYLEKISSSKVHEFNRLQERYAAFSMLMWLMDIGKIAPQYITNGPVSIDEYKKHFIDHLGSEFTFQSNSFRGLLSELCKLLNSIEKQFNSIFGENIFNETPIKRRN
jgi:hypothetical protein